MCLCICFAKDFACRHSPNRSLVLRAGRSRLLRSFWVLQVQFGAGPRGVAVSDLSAVPREMRSNGAYVILVEWLAHLASITDPRDLVGGGQSNKSNILCANSKVHKSIR